MPPGPTAVISARATRFSLSAILVVVLSVLAFSAGILVPWQLQDRGFVLPESLALASTAAIWVSIAGAPVSLLLASAAISLRSRCLNPRPRMPVVAMFVSVPLSVCAVFVIFLILYLDGLGRMH